MKPLKSIWFSLSWNWQVLLGASPLQFHSYHTGFTLLSFIRHLYTFCRKGTYWNWCLPVFADVVPGHTTLGLTTCAPGVQQWTNTGWGHSGLGPSPFWGYFWQKCPGKCPCSCPHCVVAAGQVVELWKHSWRAQHTPPQWQPKSSCDSRVRSTPCDGTESDWDTHLGTQHLFSVECPDSPWQSIPWYLNREHCR